MSELSPLMTVWVKICGLTTEEGVDAAVSADADAIGFVFAPSKRQVTAQRAAQLARRAPEKLLRVAVMQHPAQALLDEVWDVLHPDCLQTDAADLATLRLPTGLQVIPVIRAGRFGSFAASGRLLFEGPVSGTGEVADWSAAKQLSQHSQLILAGGLNPTNIAEAIKAVHPYGVDVSSGVERAPGMKDPPKIFAFVRAARASQPSNNA